MNPEFWCGKRVFVSGHTGFSGSWLSLWLQDVGARVTGYALQPPTDPSLFEVCNVAAGMTSIMSDIRNSGQLSRELAACRPEIVFHLAGHAMEASHNRPVETFQTNLLGTIHLLEAVRSTRGVRAVVVMTSDKCYVNHQWYWSYREKSQLGGDDPYSSSKACVELACAAYAKSYFPAERHAEHGVALATARTGEAIGGGDWGKDRLIPEVLQALASGQPVPIRHPHTVRAWQHVLEPINGYLVLAEHLYEDGSRCVGSWNFGPPDNSEKSVGWVVERLADLWGTSVVIDQRCPPRDRSYVKLDASKARALLGWCPQLDVETALSWVVEWKREFQRGAEMRGITLSQIRRFTCMAKGIFATLTMTAGL